MRELISSGGQDSTGQLGITAPRSKGAPHPFRRIFSEKWAHPKNFRFPNFWKNKRSPKRAEGAKILRFLLYFQGNLATFSNTTTAPQDLHNSSRKITASQDFQNLYFWKIVRTPLTRVFLIAWYMNVFRKPRINGEITEPSLYRWLKHKCSRPVKIVDL